MEWKRSTEEEEEEEEEEGAKHKKEEKKKNFFGEGGRRDFPTNNTLNTENVFLVVESVHCPTSPHIIFIWVKFSIWRASIALNWLSLYSNSYSVLFICHVCMTSIY